MQFRLSIGFEPTEVLIADLDQALAKYGAFVLESQPVGQAAAAD